MRFLHAADLHLDTAPSGLRSYPPAVAEVLRDSSLRAFDRLVDAALAHRVSCCVLAGDVYDGVERGTRAQLRFRDGLERLSAAGVRTFVVHGNHDPVEAGWDAVRSWPDLVTVFEPGDPETVVFVDGDTPVAVQGVSYGQRAEHRNLARLFRPVPDGAFGIGLLHTNVGGVRGHADYAPCSLADLAEVGARCGIDYWALGHVHNRSVLAGPHPWVVYPGCTQGRHPGASERGAKGAVLVDVTGGRAAEPSFVALDEVRFVELEVDVDPLADLGELHDDLRDRADALLAEHAGRSLVLRATLRGRGPLHAALAREGTEPLLQELCRPDATPFVWWDRIADRTSPATDLDAARRADDLLGHVLARIDDLDDDAVTATLARLPEAARSALAGAGDADDWRAGAAVAVADLLVGDAS
jgi:DNA repair exonuclease SbcCD nuclease subunit